MKESKNIMIPSLQRDYVQGERADVINPFVDSLLNSLKTEGAKLDLNYIYGSEEDDAFVPIDGQQRLITLWLLHIYFFAHQTERAASFPVALRFASREFANDFSESILVHLDYLVQNDNEGQNAGGHRKVGVAPETLRKQRRESGRRYINNVVAD